MMSPEVTGRRKGRAPMKAFVSQAGTARLSSVQGGAVSPPVTIVLLTNNVEVGRYTFKNTVITRFMLPSLAQPTGPSELQFTFKGGTPGGSPRPGRCGRTKGSERVAGRNRRVRRYRARGRCRRGGFEWRQWNQRRQRPACG